MDYTKTVVDPIRQVVKRSSLRGFVEEYGDREEDVVIVAGETHLFRKPVRIIAPYLSIPGPLISCLIDLYSCLGRYAFHHRGFTFRIRSDGSFWHAPHRQRSGAR